MAERGALTCFLVLMIFESQSLRQKQYCAPLSVWYSSLLSKGNYRAPPRPQRHSCQPTVKLHILPLVRIFPLGRGSTGAQGAAGGIYLEQ